MEDKVGVKLKPEIFDHFSGPYTRWWSTLLKVFSKAVTLLSVPLLFRTVKVYWSTLVAFKNSHYGNLGVLFSVNDIFTVL